MSPNKAELREFAISHDLDPDKLPRHIGIIMDGNGRWAKKNGMMRASGHKRGAEAARNIVEASSQLGIEFLTLFAFSDENWKRPSLEINVLMKILNSYLKSEKENFKKNNIKLETIGELSALPADTQATLKDVKKYLADCTGMTFVLALSYGGQSEIVKACRKIADRVKSGGIEPADISTDMFNSFCFSASLPDLDLMIRTSGERRLSNFMLWKLAYAELHFTQTYWPDFNISDLAEGIKCFQGRRRRYGQTDEQIDNADQAEFVGSFMQDNSSCLNNEL